MRPRYKRADFLDSFAVCLRSCHHFWFTEKKLLQTKLRKASVSGKSDDSKIPAKKKDISTSTEDLGI